MDFLTFTELPADVAEQLAVNAGIVLKTFDPAAAKAAITAGGTTLQTYVDTYIIPNIMYATTGGINCACVAEYSDWFEDVDNAPKGTKEGKHLDSWAATMSGTALTYNAENIVSMLGAADSTTTDGITTIEPRMTIQSTDFKDLWYLTDWNGGFIAMQLIDAFSDGGFTHQSTDNGKGQASFSYAGHKTATDLDRPPMRFKLFPKPETTNTETQNTETQGA